MYLPRLADMCEVAIDNGLILRHLVDVFFHESIPCIGVSPIDGSFRCVLYWFECRHMQILDGIFLAIDLMDVIYVVCGSVKALERYYPYACHYVPCTLQYHFLSLVTTMVFRLNLASHETSQNLPIDLRELCATPCNMCDSNASSGNVVKNS